MVDRQKLETILARRFPGAPLDQIAAAANAIMALDDLREPPFGERRESGVACCGQCGDDANEVASRLPCGSA